MTAEEFGLWQAYLSEEPLPPGPTAALAELIAAQANGPVRRPPGRWWSALDFMPKRWDPPKPAKPPRAASPSTAANALRQFLRR